MKTITKLSEETACEIVKAVLLPSVAGVVDPSNISVKKPFDPPPPISPQLSVYPSNFPSVVLYRNIPAAGVPGL